jgi:integrase
LRNPARISGWQQEYKRAEDELDDPRTLALPTWVSLTVLADALVDRSSNHYRGWGDVVTFAGCTAARIGEVSGCRVGDIDTAEWTWTVQRQTTPSPGGVADKGTKGKRARTVQHADLGGKGGQGVAGSNPVSPTGDEERPRAG